MFGDSSEDVFCAVGFVRSRLLSSHKTQISFIFVKARVATMKAISIPKLELLATRLKDDILIALTVGINHFYKRTDSNTVLQWLNAKGVGEILESTTIDEWHHILSAIIQLIPVHGGFI